MLPFLLQNGGGVTAAQILALSPWAWLRWNTGITQAGGLVSAWTDQSGNARNYSQGTGTNQPSFTAKSTVLGDGVDNYMDMIAAQTLAQPACYVALMNQVTWASGDRIFSSSSANGHLLLQVTGGASPQIAVNAGSTVATNTDLAVNTWGIVTTKVNGASSGITVNDGTETTGDAGAFGSVSPRLFASNSPDRYGNINLAEILMFDRIPSAGELTTIKTWLRQQAALAGITL